MMHKEKKTERKEKTDAQRKTRKEKTKQEIKAIETNA